jgi:transcriptional regulator with XRE-family HTH domain
MDGTSIMSMANNNKNGSNAMDFFEQTFDTPSKRLDFLLSDRGWKRKDLAEKMGKSAAFISQVATGDKGFVPEDWVRAAELFGVTTDWLLCRRGAPMYWPTDTPDVVPVYYSTEADAAANILDAMPPRKRSEMLAVLEVMAQQMEGNRVEVEEVAKKLSSTLASSATVLNSPTLVTQIRDILLGFVLGTGPSRD